MATLYKRNGLWWVSYYRNGKRVRESLKTKDKDLAKRERHAIESELLDQQRRTVEPKNPRLDALWTRYEEWAKDHKRQRSIDIEDISWRHFMEYTTSERVGDITRREVEGFKKWLIKRGNSEQTVNNKLKDLGIVFNRAIREGWYTGSNPVETIERYKIPKTKPKFHTSEELERLLEAATAKGRDIEWTVLLGAWAGMRRMEICWSRWEWFNFDENEPSIHIQRGDGFELKDSEDRVLPMARRIYDTLLPYRQDEGFLISADKTPGKHRYRTELHKPLTAALKDAGVTTSEPFQRLRHTFGSLHSQKGVSLFKISRWLGHSSVRVTERHYAWLQNYDAEIDSF